MDALNQKSVLLGVTGSIAAYKAVELARLLMRGGASVNVAMTPAATKFVGPMTFEAITGHPVHLDVFASAQGPVDRYGPAQAAGDGIQHIEMSKQPDLILIAPATADIIGRMANGFGDDIVTTSVLAADAPVVICPAMNQRMWANAIVQDNVKRLRDAGCLLLGPTEGDLACGEVGMGRMMEPEKVLKSLPRLLGGETLAVSELGGRRILIAMGRTEEPVDPVRYISNRSTGKMGVAIVEAARDAGADVTVISGPTSVPLPDGVNVINIRTADEMKTAVEEKFDDCDALIMVAAVADYKAATEKLHKMESGQKRASIDLEPTDDILTALKDRRKKQVMVGFALETQAEEQRARDKMSGKGLDLIVVNNPLKEGAEFGADTNLVSFMHRSGGIQRLPVMEKTRLGSEIVRQVEYLLSHPSGSRPPRVEEGGGTPARTGRPAAASRPSRAPRAARSESATEKASPSNGSPRPRSRGGRRRSPRKKPAVENKT